MRILGIASIILILIIGFYFLLKPDYRPELWHTFENNGKKITISKTSKKDIKKYNLADQKDPKQNFEIVKSKNNIDEDELKDIYENKISPNWKESLGKDVLSQLTGDIKLFLRREKTILEPLEDGLKIREIITLTFTDEDGGQTSFRAMVDPESNKILKRWDRTIIENPKNPPQGLSPSGTY